MAELYRKGRLFGTILAVLVIIAAISFAIFVNKTEKGKKITPDIYSPKTAITASGKEIEMSSYFKTSPSDPVVTVVFVVRNENTGYREYRYDLIK